MLPVLLFAVTLVVAVLLSSLPQRTLPSTSVIVLLAAFAAGAIVASIVPEIRAQLDALGERVSEQPLKLLALRVFGALFTPRLFVDIGTAATDVLVARWFKRSDVDTAALEGSWA